MLGGAERQGIEFREDKAFKNLGRRAEKGNWTVVGSLVCRLARFVEWDDDSCLPDCWDVCIVV